jgi:hypothetical protein
MEESVLLANDFGLVVDVHILRHTPDSAPGNCFLGNFDIVVRVWYCNIDVLMTSVDREIVVLVSR